MVSCVLDMTDLMKYDFPDLDEAVSFAEKLKAAEADHDVFVLIRFAAADKVGGRLD